MQTTASSRTIVGVFSNLSDAQRATDELRSLGISGVRLVENDQDHSFTGTAERQGTSTDSYSSNSELKQTGISAFFARLFGFNNERSDWSLSRDSEAYFQDAYDKKHHLVVVEENRDPAVCHEVITRFGGMIEDQGSQYYEREANREQDLTGIQTGLDRDQSLNGNRLENRLESSMDSEKVMELHEEQLDVTTERMQTGEVHVRKEIITETRTIEVPVTREEIVVERRALDGDAREGSLEAADLDMDRKEIRIPVSEEFVHIDKKVVPREEIRVSKEKITDTKTVSEDVRREEAHVESDGRVSIKNRADSKRPPATSTKSQDNIRPGV